MQITVASPDDLDSLRDLWLEMRSHHEVVTAGLAPMVEPTDSWERTRAQYERWFAADAALILVARESEVVCGYVACHLDPDQPRTWNVGPTRGDVDSLVVSQHFRGLGIGTQLLDACRRELKRRGVRFWSIGVAAGNDRAQALYEKVGFRPWVTELVAEV